MEILSLGVDVADAIIQIVAVVAYDQDLEKRRERLTQSGEFSRNCRKSCTSYKIYNSTSRMTTVSSSKELKCTLLG